MSKAGHNTWGVGQCAAAIRSGQASSEEVVGACLARISARESEVGAWAFIDAEHALTQARSADAARQAGRPLGALHGVPIGIKDIFDTWDMPTENGSPIHAGRKSGRDAHVVARLREEGAVILGKTVTTEFATYHPGKTRNPHDTARTPGGSSSGSAAAVADFMVPAALGSQTNGSVIRPASYCGVVGYKPSFGLIGRSGMFRLSRHLDHVGVFARSVEDAALVAEVLAGHDDGDPDTRVAPKPALLEGARAAPPVPPHFAFVKTAAWRHITPDAEAAFAELRAALGSQVEEVTLPEIFDDCLDLLPLVLDADLAVNLGREYRTAPALISPKLRGMIQRGRMLLATDYQRGLAARERLNAALEDIYDNCNAILTPAAPGEAGPPDSTGNPAFSTLWTLTGVPAITLPLLAGQSGMPMGVQLTTRHGDDARLLRTARWLAARVAEVGGAKTARGKRAKG